MDGWDDNRKPKWSDAARLWMLLKHGQFEDVPSMSAQEIAQDSLARRAEAVAGKAMFLEQALAQTQQAHRQTQAEAEQAQQMAQEAEMGRQQAEEALSAAQQESREKELLLQQVGQQLEGYKQSVTNIGRQMPGFDDLQESLDAAKQQRMQAEQVGTQVMQQQQMQEQMAQQQAQEQQMMQEQQMQQMQAQQGAQLAPGPNAMPGPSQGMPTPQG